MLTPNISSQDVKLLSQILHSTSKSLGRSSKLALHRESLSKLLGFTDWNTACALLPPKLDESVHVAIGLLESPSRPPKLFMSTGNDAPWRLPKNVRNHLDAQSWTPASNTILKYSRPDPAGGVQPRFWEFYVNATEPGANREVHKVPIDKHAPDYGIRDHTPVVVEFADAQKRLPFTLTAWFFTLHEVERRATNFTGAVSLPLYNTLIETLTGQLPEIRQAYCLVNSRHNDYANAIVRCDERGQEIEIVEYLPYMPEGKLWEHLAEFNKELGLSLLDVAEITKSCFSHDNE